MAILANNPAAATEVELSAEAKADRYLHAGVTVYFQMLDQDDYKTEYTDIGRLVRKAGIAWHCSQAENYSSLITELYDNIDIKVSLHKAKLQKDLRGNGLDPLPEVYFDQAHLIFKRAMDHKIKGVALGLRQAGRYINLTNAQMDMICSQGGEYK